MNGKHSMTFYLSPLIFALLLLLHVPIGARASGDMEDLIPPISCGAGWKIEGKQLFYDRDTLSDRIDGEAELYLPYGFERLAAARYASVKSPDTGIDVEIYRMGSLLDAFGIYASYRQKEGKPLAVGAESNLSVSQLFLYQGRHFVHVQVTGADASDPDALAACGRAVASRLPGDKDRPPELLVFDRPEVVKGSERYLPQSLLGYNFLNKGIMADAVVEGTNLQIFLLLSTTAQSASAALESYRSQLSQGKIELGGKSATFLEGVDPLYGPVIVLKKGKCLAGALKFSGKTGIRALLESVCR
jgi:hypothetical protein